MKRIWFAVCCLPLLCGCATTGVTNVPAPRNAMYVESEYAPYREPGTAVITGQAFAKTRGGEVKFGAGNTVVMNPVTSYSDEWWARAVRVGEHLEDPDPRIISFSSQATADGEGRFKFERLPAGDYYIACWIRWETGGGYGSNDQAVCVGKKVHVDSGQTIDVILPTVSYWGIKPGGFSRGWVPTGDQ